MTNSTIYMPPRGVAGAGGDTSIILGDNASSDAFQRQRVSNPVTLFSDVFRYEDLSQTWVEKAVGTASASYIPNQSAYSMDLGSGLGDRMIRQTREYFPYQPGKSHQVMITGVLGAPKAGVASHMGYNDDEDGVRLSQTENGPALTLRSYITGSAVDETVLQADWSEDDKLNGAGVSGITLDLEQSQILVVDLQYLGVGRIRVYLDIDGLLYKVHEFLNANVRPSVYMSAAALPVRYEIENVGTPVSPTSMTQICATVVSEGGYDLGGTPRSVTRGNVALTVTPGAWLPLISIRPRPTYHGKVNRARILKIGFDVLAENKAAEVAVMFNPTLTAPAFNPTPDDSAIEFDIAATAASGGDRVGGALAAAGTGQRGAVLGETLDETIDIPLGLDVDGANPTHMTLMARAVGTNADLLAGFDWREYL